MKKTMILAFLKLVKPLSVFVAMAGLLIPNSAFAKPPNQSQKLMIYETSCETVFNSYSDSGAGESLPGIVISLLDVALDEVISVVDKQIEKRKKERTATYGVSELVENGLGSSTRCLMLVNGELAPNNDGEVEKQVLGLNNNFYLNNSIQRVDSFFAFEVTSRALSGGAKGGVGTLQIIPYHASFFNTSAKRQKKNGKSIAATLTLETVYKDSKGFQKDELKKVLDFGEIKSGTEKTRSALKEKIVEEFINAEILARPLKVNVTIVESEDESIAEKILISFYETEKDNIKETIQKIWGTDSDD